MLVFYQKWRDGVLYFHYSTISGNEVWARCIVFPPLIGYHSEIGMRFFWHMLLLNKSPRSNVKCGFSELRSNKTERKHLLKQTHEKEAELEEETEDYRRECPLI